MQALLRHAGEPALLALARSCALAARALAPCQQAACGVASRQLASSAQDGQPTASASQRELDNKQTATPGDSDGRGETGHGSGVSSGGGHVGRRGGQPGYPHRFNQPYSPDIRRFVHRLEKQQLPPVANSVLQGDGTMHQAAESEGLPPPRLDLVQQYLSEETASKAEQRAVALRQAMLDFQRFEGDTGSSEVQVARLTTRITQLAEHMRIHKKDYASRRGLEAVIAQRRALLQYLRRKDFGAYAQLISRLGLRDTYAKLDRITLQIQQRRQRGPSKPRRNVNKRRRR